MQSAPLRHWALPETHNIRDLGGYPRQAGGTTQWGRLLRADNLHFLNPSSCDQLIGQGLALVIDLRSVGEIAAQPNPLAADDRVTYVHIALYEALAPIAMAQVPFDMAERYCTAIDTCGDKLNQVLALIANAPPGLVLFHCTAGKDRTGIISALLLLLAGVSDDDVCADYALTAEATGLLERLRESALASGGAPDHIERVLACPPQAMERLLAHLRRHYGSVERYLTLVGINAACQQQLLARLCDQDVSPPPSPDHANAPAMLP